MMLLQDNANATGMVRQLWSRIKGLSRWQKLGLATVVLLHVVAASVFFYIGGDAILHIWLSTSPFGIPILFLGMTVTAIPPISGFGTMVTIAGMAFASAVSSEKNMRVTWWYSVGRFFYGWIIASVGLVISSYISFVFLQYILARMHGHWRVLDTIKGDRRFRALQEAVHERGLWMAVLSRFCPMPYCCTYTVFALTTDTNLLLASLDALPVSVYILSSVLASPRLMLHVFMGAKMFELMDRDVRAHQDMGTRIMNGVYVFIGFLLGIGSSWLIWRETSRILHLDSEAEWAPVDVEEDTFILNDNDTDEM